MIASILRALAGLIGFLLLAVLAIAGLAVAIFSIQSGTGALSLTKLSEIVYLPHLRGTVGHFLHSLQVHGPTAAVAAASGAGAVLLGLALLVGALVPRRERMLIIERRDDGILAARRRAVAQAIRAVAEQPLSVDHAKARIRPRRSRSGGSARVTLQRAETSDQAAVIRTADERLAPLASALSLDIHTRSRVSRRSRRGARVH